MKYIELTQGYKAIVDDEDFEYLNQWKWHYANGYATRLAYIKYEDKPSTRKTLFLHRVLLNAEFGTIIDHKNHDGLDNRKENLRFVSNHQNQLNSKARSHSSTGLKGISLHKMGKTTPSKYCARILINGVRKSIGYFYTKEEAAKAYDEAAIKYHGEFACLNYPNTTRASV